MYTHMKPEGPPTAWICMELPPAHKVAMKDYNWCQHLFNLLVSIYPNSYDKLNNMELDLNVSTKVKFSANDQDL